MLSKDVVDGAFDIAGSVELVALFCEYCVLVTMMRMKMSVRFVVHGLGNSPVEPNTIITLVCSICT